MAYKNKDNYEYEVENLKYLTQEIDEIKIED